MDFPPLDISVILPDCDRIERLHTCLEGFVAQTVSCKQFELILAGPRLADQEESLRSQFGGQVQMVFIHAGTADLSTVRNAAIRKARAPILALYSSQLQPLPELLDYCLNFHAADLAMEHACLLGYAADPMFQRLHPFPARAGVQLWRAFRSEAITCKTELFLHGQFQPAYGSMAGPELALRLSRRIDFGLFYQPVLTGTRMEPTYLRAACEAHYLAAYFEYLLARAYPGAISHSPSEIIDAEQLTALAATIKSMENRRAEPGSLRLKMLAVLQSRIEAHARAEGWAAASSGHAPNPPGGLAPFLK